MRTAGFSSHRTVFAAGVAAIAALLLAGTRPAVPAAPGHDTHAQAAGGDWLDALDVKAGKLPWRSNLGLGVTPAAK